MGVSTGVIEIFFTQILRQLGNDFPVFIFGKYSKGFRPNGTGRCDSYSQLRKDRIEFRARREISIAEKCEKTQVTGEVSAGNQD